MYLIKKVSELSGVSVRTLHHYDEIGLLSPQKHENGYRYYSENDMEILQTILFYKYLGFSLKQIKELLLIGDNDLLIHLKKQLDLMQHEKERLLILIDTLKKTIESQERRTTMSTEEKFRGFSYQDNEKYTQAAMEKYGKEIIEASIQKQRGREEELTEKFNALFFSFAENMSNGLQAISKENVQLAKTLHHYLCTYSFDCSYDVFSGIGYGYVQNEEFNKNLSKFGEGVPQYVCNVIQQYVKEVSKQKN